MVHDHKKEVKRQMGIGDQRDRRNWVSHPHLKDEVIGKTRRHMSLRKHMPRSAPEKQVFREYCAHLASCCKLW